jgi:hypothetical protein
LKIRSAHDKREGKYRTASARRGYHALPRKVNIVGFDSVRAKRFGLARSSVAGPPRRGGD